MAAKIETIIKRIEGKEKEIKKLTAKIERINKAKETNWEVNPYYYGESDLRYALRDLEEAKAGLEKYQQQLAEAKDAEASRNVPAITQFLTEWKRKATEWYMHEYELYLVAKEEFKAKRKEHAYNTYVNDWQWKRDHREEWKAIDKDYDHICAVFSRHWSHVERLIDRKIPYTEMLEAMLTLEYNRKYDLLLKEVIAITGEITDASYLHVAENGDLNGWIIGKKGTADVNTFSAGGWNIQCYHYRTRVTRKK